MNWKLSVHGLVLILFALIASGCGQTTAEPTESLTPIRPEVATEVATETPRGEANQVRTARDLALAYVNGRYGDEAPPLGLTWAEEDITPEGLVGSVTNQYKAEDWVVTISYPVVAPDSVIYQVVVSNQSTEFQWEGTVDAAGQVAETPATIAGQPIACWYGRIVSMQPGAQFDDYLALEPEGAGELGIEGADADLVAQIESLRDSSIYAHFWGTLTCDVPDYGGCQLRVSQLRPEGPGGPFFDPASVEGWEGTIINTPPDAQFDDIFIMAGDFAVGYGIESFDPSLTVQLQSLRDSESIIRVWGQVTCPAINAYGTSILVDRIEIVWNPPMPPPTPTIRPTPVQSWTEPVENWWGEIISNPPGSQFDDYFQRQIVDGGQYGIESRDPVIQAQIDALHDTGTTVHLWGTLYHNVLDMNATQIIVTRLEIPEPWEPPEITEEPVEGWVGAIIKYPHGSQFDHYFERNDGQRSSISAMDADAVIKQLIEEYRWTGAQVQVWGKLVRGIPAVEAREIQVERIDAVTGPTQDTRNFTHFATTSASSYLPTDRWGQYQPWMAIDGAPESSWVEGVAGSGIGEWFELTFPGVVEVWQIGLDVGYDRDDDVFYANNRIKRATFIFSSGEQITLDFTDTRGMQMVSLARAPGQNIQTSSIRVVIEKVYRGSRHDDTCLAEIEVWGIALPTTPE